MWYTWLRIAIRQAREARLAREELAQPDNEGNAFLIRKEFEASLVAVAASAHALDALYGSITISQPIRDQWRQRGTKRRGAIRESLKALFDTGQVNQLWVGQFDWLFDLRDAAAHAKERLQEPFPHPAGVNTAQEPATYSVESAEKAVCITLSVLRWCADHPRTNITEAQQWASSARTAIDDLEMLRAE